MQIPIKTLQKIFHQRTVEKWVPVFSARCDMVLNGSVGQVWLIVIVWSKAKVQSSNLTIWRPQRPPNLRKVLIMQSNDSYAFQCSFFTTCRIICTHTCVHSHTTSANNICCSLEPPIQDTQQITFEPSLVFKTLHNKVLHEHTKHHTT